MKYIGYCVKNALSQLKSEKRISFIIILTIGITFAAILILIKIFFITAEDISEIQLQKRTYSLNAGYPEKSSADIYNKTLDSLLKDKEFPEIHKISAFFFEYIENSEYGEVNNEFLLDVLNFNEEISIIEGRSFEEEEFFNGSQLVIVSEFAMKNYFSDKSVNDFIKFGEDEYRIIGVSKGEKNYIAYNSIINKSNILLSLNEIEYEKELSGAQIDSIEKILKNIDINSSVISLYDIYSPNFMDKLLYAVMNILLIIFCMSTVVMLLRYLSLSKLREFTIYKIVGAKSVHIYTMLYCQSFFLLIISLIFGFGFYYFSIPTQNYFMISGSLPSGVFLAVIFVMCISLIFSSIPYVKRMVKFSPVENLTG